MLLRITRRHPKLIVAVPAAFFAFALLLVLLPLMVQAAPENWLLRSSAGSACGNGDRESLNQTAGSNAATKVLDGSGDTWNRTETARTIGAGNWQLFFDATTGSGSGSPNKVTVLVERRNSSCVVQGSAIIDEEVTTTKGTLSPAPTATLRPAATPHANLSPTATARPPAETPISVTPRPTESMPAPTGQPAATPPPGPAGGGGGGVPGFGSAQFYVGWILLGLLVAGLLFFVATRRPSERPGQ